MKRDNALIISKLLGGGSLAPADADFRRIADLLRLQRRGGADPADADGGGDPPRGGMGGNGSPVSKQTFDRLLSHRQQLYDAALTAVRALLDFDQTLLPLFSVADAAPAPSVSLRAAVRSVAPMIQTKTDWVALYMLASERGYVSGYTELCRIIAEEAPDAPQPQRQTLASGEWMRHGHRFPDWQPLDVRYDKFRRHYLIAQAAAPLLPSS